MLVCFGFNCIRYKVVSMTDPHALNRRIIRLPVCYYWKMGFMVPMLKQAYSANTEVWMIKGPVVADTAADPL